MSHRGYLEAMQAALDGKLTAPERAQLREHLAECAACQAEWDTLTAVEHLFQAAPRALPRPGFSGRFRARLQQRRSRPRLVWGALALGLGAVSAAALVLPVGVGALVSMARAAQQPATSAALFTGLNATALFADTVLGALLVTARGLVTWAAAYPLTWLLSLAALAAAAAWMVVMIRGLVPQGVTR